MIKRSHPIPIVALLLLALMAGACNDVGGGAELKKQELEFPVGIAVHSRGFALVASSNFDLASRSGSVQVIDLNRLATDVEAAAVNPEEYETIESNQYILDGENQAVGIGSFAGSLKLAEWQDGGLAVVAVRESNHLAFIDISISDSGSGPSMTLDCGGSGRFGKCDGARHLLNIDRDDPFDLLLLDGEDTEEGLERIAFVTFLRSGAVGVVQIPPGAGDVPRLDYMLETGVNGVNDLAYSAESGMIYATNRASVSRSNPISYFRAGLGIDARIYRMDLFPTLLGYETRGVDFTPDGLVVAILVRSPNLLAFLDASTNSSGLPYNGYLGHVVVGNSPSRVRIHEDLALVTCAEEDTVYVIDVNTMRLVDLREDVCRGPYDIDFFDSGDHSWGLITCFEDDVVAVLDVNPDSATFLKVLARVGKSRN